MEIDVANSEICNLYYMAYIFVLISYIESNNWQKRKKLAFVQFMASLFGCETFLCAFLQKQFFLRFYFQSPFVVLYGKTNISHDLTPGIPSLHQTFYFYIHDTGWPNFYLFYVGRKPIYFKR